MRLKFPPSIFLRRLSAGQESGTGAPRLRDQAATKRKAGQLLKAMEKQKPGDYRKRSPTTTVSPTLSELGISKKREEPFPVNVYAKRTGWVKVSQWLNLQSRLMSISSLLER